MPYIESSVYNPAGLFKNGHFSSMYPTLLRKTPAFTYDRERIDTPDGDFLDIDFIFSDSQKIVILCHGLEGSSQSTYIRGMALAFHKEGWNVAAMNYRGCSGELNRNVRFYHSGATEDLNTVMDHVLTKNYKEIVLVGFSLGGNLVLKYLGENEFKKPAELNCVVTFSVPVDLKDSSKELIKKKNWIYTQRFLIKLRKKVRAKKALMPGKIDDFHFLGIINLVDFDEYYTAPLHGFIDANDYYEKSSSRQWLKNIEVPTLLVNAKNDPFLGETCYPFEESRANPNFYFEAPKWGGHVGFYDKGMVYWSEKGALEFINSNLR